MAIAHLPTTELTRYLCHIVGIEKKCEKIKLFVKAIFRKKKPRKMLGFFVFFFNLLICPCFSFSSKHYMERLCIFRMFYTRFILFYLLFRRKSSKWNYQNISCVQIIYIFFPFSYTHGANTRSCPSLHRPAHGRRRSFGNQVNQGHHPQSTRHLSADHETNGCHACRAR